jgi:hypothetical protein
LGEFEKFWLVTLLSRRGATALMAAAVLFAATYSFGLAALLWDRHVSAYLPDALFGFSAVQVASGGALLAVAVVTVLKMWTEPGRLDRSLEFREEATPGDAGLSVTEAEELNRTLDRLRTAIDAWRQEGDLEHRVRLGWSPELGVNAVTYGSFLALPRVVFGADLLLGALGGVDPGSSAPSPRRRLTREELTGVLAHELGHVESGDAALGAVIGGVMRVLNFFYLPLLIIDRLLAFVAWLLSWLPLFGGLVAWVFSFATRGVLALGLLLYRCCLLVDRLHGHVREYSADAFAVKLLGAPDQVLAALTALANLQLREHADPDGMLARMWRRIRRVGRRMVRPANWDRYATLVWAAREEEPQGALAGMAQFFSDLGSTHPPLPARLNRIAKQGFLLDRDRKEGLL